MGIEVAPLVVKSEGNVVPCPGKSGLSSMEVLLLKGQVILPKNIVKVLLNGKLNLLPGHLGLLIWLTQYAEKEVTLLLGMTGLNYRRDIGLLLWGRATERSVSRT